MSYRILQFSDSHLGFSQYSMSTRLRDFGLALDEVLRVATEKEVDLVVDCGDTFHSPEPDPLSVAMYRRFAERLQTADIPFMAIVGNHNVHRVGRQFSENPSWMEAVSDRIIRPERPEDPISLKGRDGSFIDIVAADWMPSDQIDSFLARIPKQDGPIDAIFMHQSTEGFMPVIARSEMTIKQVDGIARYVGVGDIHVMNKIVGPLGTLVGSSGSTELVSLGESVHKYVVLIEIPTKGDIQWTPVPIQTRRIVQFPLIDSSEALIDAATKLRDGRNVPIEGFHGQEDPLVILPYGSFGVERQALELKKTLEAEGFTMLRFVREAAVEQETNFVATEKRSSMAMPEIIAELLEATPHLIPVAQDLWNNHENANLVLDALLESIRKESATEAPPPPPVQ